MLPIPSIGLGRQTTTGGLLTLNYKSINFSQRPESHDTLADPHLEELTITVKLGNTTELIITNVYMPPAVPTTPACTRWNHPEEDLSSGKLESTHPSRSIVKSIEVFMESSQLYAATLTHSSTESLTTGPVYDPLLLLLALPVMCTRTQDRQSTPARSASKTALAKAPATCVQDVRIEYIQDVLVFEMLRIIVKPMAGSVPPV